MDGDYNNLFDDYVIVDCRYPYEFEGGHVKVSLFIPGSKVKISAEITGYSRSKKRLSPRFSLH